jgi:hypothetical protein
MGTTITAFAVMAKNEGVSAFGRNQALNKLLWRVVVGDAESRQVDPLYCPCGECSQDRATTNPAEKSTDISRNHTLLDWITESHRSLDPFAARQRTTGFGSRLAAF